MGDKKHYPTPTRDKMLWMNATRSVYTVGNKIIIPDVLRCIS